MCDTFASREQLLYPLQFTDLIESVDVEATVESGGPSGQAGAIRYAMSLALQSFVSREMVEQMRLGVHFDTQLLKGLSTYQVVMHYLYLTLLGEYIFAVFCSSFS